MTERSDFATSLGGLGVLAVAGCLVVVRGVLAAADVALVLAVGVVVAAAVGGRRSGVVTGAVAAMSFDFLFTRPYGSLKVSGVGDVLTTALLLVLGLVAGSVAERLHHARSRSSDLGELARLHRLGERAARGDSGDDLTLQVAAELVDALHLVDCWYEAVPFLGPLPDLPAPGRHLPRRGASILLRVAGRPTGRFVLVPTVGADVPAERRVVAVTLVDQLAAVLSVRAA
ncbi:MAG: Osmosensitive channel histidine kinaselike protein [Actinomycetia bacterium]|nr:Osmosensitive channel histidine kinaselike protein [Actinomycetes bacterium]